MNLEGGSSEEVIWRVSASRSWCLCRSNRRIFARRKCGWFELASKPLEVFVGKDLPKKGSAESLFERTLPYNFLSHLGLPIECEFGKEEACDFDRRQEKQLKTVVD